MSVLTPSNPTSFDVRAGCGYQTFSLTIPAGQTVSNAIDLGYLTPVAVIAPGTGNSVWTAAPISFQAAYATAGTIGAYGAVQDGGSVLQTLSLNGGEFNCITFPDAFALRLLKVVSGVPGSLITQVNLSAVILVAKNLLN